MGSFTLNEAGIKATISTSQSPVGRNIGRRGIRVARAAQRSSEFKDCTGALRGSIQRRGVLPGEGPSVLIVATAPHALVVHEGRRGFSVADSGGSSNWLVWRKQCTKGPGTIFTKSTGPAAGRPYLRNALKAAAG